MARLGRARRFAPIIKTKIQFAAAPVQVILSGALRYAVRRSISATKSLRYAVMTEITAIGKSLRYAVRRTPSAATKALTYAVTRQITAIGKSLRYAVRTHPAPARTIQYRIKVPVQASLALRYTVTTEVTAIGKSVRYAVRRTPGAASLGLGYVVARQPILPLSARYTVIRTVSPVQKALGYAVTLEVTAIGKGLAYAVRRQSSVAQAMRYAVRRTPPAFALGLGYIVAVPTTMPRTLRYAVKRARTKSLGLRYVMSGIPQPALQLGLGYSVRLIGPLESIRIAIVNRLRDTCDLLSEVYRTDRSTIESYPAAVVSPSDEEADYHETGATSTKETYVFTVRIFYPFVDGQETADLNLERAVDQVMASLRDRRALGEAADWIKPAPHAWGYLERGEGVFRTAEIKVSAVRHIRG